MSIEELKAKQRLAEQEAFNKGNVEAWDEVIAPDVIVHTPPLPDAKGLEAYKQSMLAFSQGFTDIRFKLEEIIGQGETTAVRYTINMKHTGVNPMFPVPATGKEVVYSGSIFSNWKNGKIVEQFACDDFLGFLQQLGIAPPMGQQ